jgi:hypothetical protein
MTTLSLTQPEIIDRLRLQSATGVWIVNEKAKLRTEEQRVGHSAKVMKDHYLRLSDSDFAEASMGDQIAHAKDHAVKPINDGKKE